MKPADRQKMCPNCDGRIPYDVSQCPYCFATVQVESPAHPAVAKNQTIQDSLTNLYAPPYGAKNQSFEQPERPAPAKMAERIHEKEMALPVEKEEAEIHDTKAFWPILFLTLAGNLFTLGVLQFFFSDEGLVHLEMNGSYWFLFVLLSLPLMYFGLKKINQTK